MIKRAVSIGLIFLICLLTSCGKSEAVTNVETMISELGNIDLDSEEAIVEAEKSYNELTDKEKEKVTNYQTLSEAREKLDVLLEEERVAQYYITLQDTTAFMLNGASLAETVCGLIHDVWYNCIYEKSNDRTNKYTQYSRGKYYSDFNTALQNLFADDTYIEAKDLLEEGRTTVQGVMRDLKNPPEQYKEAYEDIKTLWDCYEQFVGMATNPTGSLQSYTDDYNDIEDRFMSSYRLMQLHFD